MKKKIGLFLTVFCAMLLSACGGGNVQKQKTDGGPVDWKTKGFAVSGDIQEEQEFWAESYIKSEHETLDWNEKDEEIMGRGQEYYPLRSIVFDGKLYTLFPIMKSDRLSVTRGILEIVDLSTFETVTEELSAQQMGIREGDISLVVDMDILKDGQYVFEILGYSEEGREVLPSYDAFSYFDPEGAHQWVDLLPEYLKCGARQEDDRKGTWESHMGMGECRLDASGNSYIRSGVLPNLVQNLYVFSPEGRFLAEYPGSDKTYVGEPAKTEDGELIFPVYDQTANETRIIWYDGENASFPVLAQLKGESILRLFGIQENQLYYESHDGIVRWNVASGERKLVFRYDENGVNNYSGICFYLRKEEPPVLKLTNITVSKREEFLEVLSSEPVEKPEAIRLVSLVEEYPHRPQACVAIASRSNPEYFYEYQDAGNQDIDDFRNRIFAEMAAGKGPDLLCVTRQDMKLLQEQGMITDLREFLPEDVLEKVLPAVLQMGTVDGELVGLASSIYATSLSIGRDVWPEDSWSWEELLDLIETGQVDNRISHSSEQLKASQAALKTLLEYSLADSFLIDWEKGESHFEDERFVRMMEALGRYGLDDLGMEENRIKGEGAYTYDSLAYFIGIHQGENRHYVGYPTEGENGSYIDAYGGMVVVNRNLSNPEAVSAYLETLLDGEVQYLMLNAEYRMPIISLAEGEAKYNHLLGPECPDGSTYIERVNELLSICVPAPETYPALWNIISEELMAYYEGANGNRTPREIAEMIDNRIQLYLDEQGVENVR